MEDIKVVLIKQCGCEFNYAVSQEDDKCKHCNSVNCKGCEPPRPEFITVKGRLLTAVEWENHQEVYSKSDSKLATGCLPSEDEPDVLNEDGSPGRNPIHSCCQECKNKNFRWKQ